MTPATAARGLAPHAVSRPHVQGQTPRCSTASRRPARRTGHFGGAVSVHRRRPARRRRADRLHARLLPAGQPARRRRRAPPDIVESRSLAIMGNVVLTTPRKLERVRAAAVRLRRHRAAACVGQGQLRVCCRSKPTCSATTSAAAPSASSRERAGLRFDLRYFSNLKPSESTRIAIGRVQLSYWTATVGVVLKSREEMLNSEC